MLLLQRSTTLDNLSANVKRAQTKTVQKDVKNKQGILSLTSLLYKVFVSNVLLYIFLSVISSVYMTVNRLSRLCFGRAV